MTKPDDAGRRDHADVAADAEDGRNRVECPRCGEVRLETPPGTVVLPTLGMARKAAGVAGECDCGRAPHERPGAVDHVPGEPGGPGTVPMP